MEAQLNFNPNIKQIFTENKKLIEDIDKVPKSNNVNHTTLIKHLKLFKEKIRDNNLIVTLGDKGAGTVILDRITYNKKASDFFMDNNIVEIKNNPTITFSNIIRKYLRENSTYLAKFNINSFNSNEMNPLIPTLKCLIKLHKPEKTIRPIISNQNTPTNRVSKLIQNFLYKHFHNKFTHTIKNSTDLINKLKNFKLNKNSKLVSFDIKNLYTNIPINQTLDFIKKHLINFQDHNKLNILEINSFIGLLEIVCNQNFFTFENKFYRMKDGLPMGSPISGILADIFVDHFETELFSNKNHLFNKDIAFYARYVDDILVVYEGCPAKLKGLFNLFNNISNLEFTLEMEQSQSINFLDLEITRNMNKRSVEFNIFRKPTATDTIIPKKSFTCEQHKMACFRFFFNRIYNIPLNLHNLTEEIKKILKIGFNNGYSLEDMQSIYFKVHNSQVNKLIYPQIKVKRKFIGLPYHPTIINPLKQNLEKFGLAPAFVSNNKIHKHIFNNKHQFNSNELSGIYEIKCPECDKVYIGQTGRNISKRFKEHLTKPSSAVYKHINSCNHKIEFENMKLLLHLKKSREMDLYEELHINVNNNNNRLINDITELNNFRNFLKFI